MRTYSVSITALLVALCLFSAEGRAEDKPAAGQAGLATAEQRADFRTDRMKEALNLNAEQVEKVRAINLKYAKEAEKITASGDESTDQFRQFAEMSTRKDDELKKVLTSDQFQAYETLRKKWQARAAAEAPSAEGAAKEAAE